MTKFWETYFQTKQYANLGGIQFFIFRTLKIHANSGRLDKVHKNHVSSNSNSSVMSSSVFPKIKKKNKGHIGFMNDLIVVFPFIIKYPT